MFKVRDIRMDLDKKTLSRDNPIRRRIENAFGRWLRLDVHCREGERVEQKDWKFKEIKGQYSNYNFDECIAINKMNGNRYLIIMDFYQSIIKTHKSWIVKL